MVLPCQVWFDMEAPEAFERDDLDTIATTEQHLRTSARSEVRIESPREIPADSKFLNTSAGTQKVEGEFAVRNVTKLTDAAGQLTDEGREVRPSKADGLVRSMEKSEYVTPCDEQLCEKESSQVSQMDRGEIDVKEERRVRAKRVPVLPTDKEKDMSEIVHMTVRSQCETEDSHKYSTKRVAGATSDHESWTLCPRRAHGPCVDTEDPQCGGNVPSASRKFRDSCGQWCAGKP